MFHCRSLARTGGRLAARIYSRPAWSQIRCNSVRTPKHTKPFKLYKSPHEVLHAARKTEQELDSYRVTWQTAETISLHFDGLREPLHVSTLWLRDACPCEACVGPSSGQKSFGTHQIPQDLDVESASFSEDGNLHIKWKNDIPNGSETSPTHTSIYSRQFLLRRLYRITRPDLPERELWNVNAIKNRLSYHQYDQYIGDEQTFAKAMADYWRDGIVILNDVPESETAVEDIAERIGPIQETIYGRTWDVKSKPQAENIAYTNEYLGPHQDLLYWKDIPTVQVLHCLRNDCDGGESLFVDGWLAAVQMFLAYPEYANLMARVPVFYTYSKGGHLLQRAHEVLQQKAKPPYIRWSPPFQSPFIAGQVSGDKDYSQLKKWRDGASKLAELLESKDRMLELKLQPGQAVIFDNRRILHGRNTFNATQGERWLKGTYVSDCVVTSRLHGVLPTSDEVGATVYRRYGKQTREICESEGNTLPWEDRSGQDDKQPAGASSEQQEQTEQARE